jgi:signal transduction histidine kinase
MKKKANYIPRPQDNPALVARRAQKALDDYRRAKQVWEMEKAAYKNHFSKITNFTSHDIKNAIQNMDAVISTLDINHVTYEQIETIKGCLNSMRLSLDNFYNLSFEGRKIRFTLKTMADLVELLNKATTQDAKINFTQSINNDNIEIHQSFHSILQVLNNLVINSITAFSNDAQDREIHINYNIIDDKVVIVASDNACKIQEDLKDKIFEIYFSTTGGSGIGLAHAKFLLDNIGGTIELISNNNIYCTNFEIKFPLSKNDQVGTDN